MVHFLIHRPIAVTMAFIAIMILGILAASNIPVALMPAIDIPEITVQINKKNSSARELENALSNPLRRELAQVAYLTDISSETRDEKGTISLQFEYGTDIDFAFIEVNEKIDRAMNHFPRDIERPKVIKANATDIPVFYLNLTLKNKDLDSLTTSQPKTQNPKPKTFSTSSLFPVDQKFIELSGFASHVIRKRLEQLPDVAMVDISGSVYAELLIIPNLEKLQTLHVDLNQLEGIIKNSNLNLGNLLIQDGQYQYNVRFNATLSNKNDIENIYFKVEDRLFQLKDVATVIEHPQKRKGMVISDGQDAITMAIIQQSDAQMSDLQKHLGTLMDLFRKDYPHLQFTITRDQTSLLEYSISNLNQDMIWGGILAFLIMFLFLRDFKSPLLIGITLPSSLIVSLIFFYLLDISINIISLSGLVLGVGMMIDNSIIVIDNIVQYRERKFTLNEACVKGASEVFFPMLSSVLTTCAVFVPLIFISGISGALFYDEAMSVVIGAFVSLMISVTLIPVYYRLFYIKDKPPSKNWLHKINHFKYETAYEKSFKFVMRNQKFTWAIVLLMIPIGLFLYVDLPKSKLPPITREDIIVKIDWNEKINITENNARTQMLLSSISKHVEQQTCWIGEQQFLLDRKADFGASEVSIYIRAKSPEALNLITENTAAYIHKNHPVAHINYSEAANIFNFIFNNDESPLTARLRFTKEMGEKSNESLRNTLMVIQKNIPEIVIPNMPMQEHIVLKADPLKMVAYDIDYDNLYGKLKSAFNAREVFMLTDNQHFIPVILGEKPKLVKEILSNAFVAGNDGMQYPVRELVTEERSEDIKIITAGQEGEFYPINMDISDEGVQSTIDRIKSALHKDHLFEVEFTGSIFSNQKMIRELTLVLIISLALLYFILAAQFESLTLPLIVLIEIPIDIFAAFAFLKIFNAGINLMSLIGIVVMGGIIINDSILKIDTINQLMKEGNSLLKSMLVGGQRRLKPILMTSFTTILAMVPMLLTPGLGSELQKPLAVALMGGMTIGTLVSLYFIPLCYYYLKRKRK